MLLQLVHVSQHAAWNTNRQDRQLALGLVLHATGDIDHHSLMQLDLFVIQDHAALAGDHVIEFVGALMVMQLGVLDLDMVHLSGGAILLFDEATDLPTGLRPGLDYRRIAA